MDNVFLLISKDEFLIERGVMGILHDLDVDEDIMQICDLDNMSVNELISELTTVSVFDSCRLFWIKNPSALTRKTMYDDESLAILKKFIMSPLETSYLIFSQTDYYEGSELAGILKKYAVIRNFDTTGGTMEQFAKNYITENNMKMNSQALQELLVRVNDYQSLENELLKLKYYALDEEIDGQMVNKIVSKNLETKVYELTNALISRNKNQALGIYYDLLDSNETPRRIFSNILGKLNEILIVKKLIEMKKNKEDVAAYFSVSSGRAYYMVKNAGEITKNTLERYFMELRDLDYQIKAGIVDEKIGLELFILKA